MWVILHRVADYVGHFVESPVIKSVHRVEYTALHGLQAVVDAWHGTLQYHI